MVGLKLVAPVTLATNETTAFVTTHLNIRGRCAVTMQTTGFLVAMARVVVHDIVARDVRARAVFGLVFDLGFFLGTTAFARVGWSGCFVAASRTHDFFRTGFSQR